MSRKRKSDDRLPYLCSFSNHVERRKVYLVDGIEYGKNEIDGRLFRLTIGVNHLIQDMNYIVARNIPYISLEATNIMDEKIRVLLSNSKEEARQSAFLVLENIPVDISHLLDVRMVAAPPKLKEREFDNTNAKIVIDPDLTEASLSDIFLDIAMFNSYSFLQQLPLKQKQGFNALKFDYARKHNLKTYLAVNYSENIGYFSFALSCRNEDQEFDIVRYIDIWNSFISECFEGKDHVEPSISDQISRRIDPSHIPIDYYKEFESKTPGIYFILRLNSHTVSKKYVKFIKSQFRINEISVGPLKIVDSTAMTTASSAKAFNECCQLRDIAAFKVVKQ